jgi:type IV secretion system protein VirB2
MAFARLASCLTTAALAAERAFAQSTTSPRGSGPIVAAVDWMRSGLLGPIATSVAVIAVAFIGFMMLTGRMNWKHGITVIVGCFIIFGATAIVGGIQMAANSAGQ